MSPLCRFFQNSMNSFFPILSGQASLFCLACIQRTIKWQRAHFKMDEVKVERLLSTS